MKRLRPRLPRRGLPGRLPRPRIGRRFLLLILLGLLSYAAFLAASWPAAHAWSMVQRHAELPPELHVETVSGTVWSGRMAGIRWDGVDIRQLRWQIAARALLRGRLDLDLSATFNDGTAEGLARISRGGLRLDAVNGRFPATDLVPLLAGMAPPQFSLEGTILFDINRLRMDWAGQFSALEGRLAWHDAAATVDEYAELGGMTTTLRERDGMLFGELGDTGGPLILTGDWRLEPDGNYVFEAHMNTREEASDVLRQTVRLLGPTFALEGDIPR